MTCSLIYERHEMNVEQAAKPSNAIATPFQHVELKGVNLFVSIIWILQRLNTINVIPVL